MEKTGFVRHGHGGGGVIRLPPGFRFHPTDQELVELYLKRKVFSFPLPASIIPEIQLSKFDPWDLPPSGCGGGAEKERYLFNFREAKYRNGSRSNRAAGSGYWKSTGKDREVMGNGWKQVVGMKKVLVFYRGKPPHGSRTDWVMHEYRLTAAPLTPTIISQHSKNSNNPIHNSMVQMEDWVLCRIFEKKRASRDDDLEMGKPYENRARIDNQIRFIDFLRQGPRPEPESSCVTQVSRESSSEEEESSSNTVHRSSVPR